jgi:hypothetical protein
MLERDLDSFLDSHARNLIYNDWSHAFTMNGSYDGLRTQNNFSSFTIQQKIALYIENISPDKEVLKLSIGSSSQRSFLVNNLDTLNIPTLQFTYPWIQCIIVMNSSWLLESISTCDLEQLVLQKFEATNKYKFINYSQNSVIPPTLYEYWVPCPTSTAIFAMKLTLEFLQTITIFIYTISSNT